MIHPSKVRKGDEILASKINEIIDAIEERTPLSFPNGFLTPLPHGFHVRTLRGSGGGSATQSYRWDFSISGGDNPVLKFTFPGSINGIVPSNIFASFPVQTSGVQHVKLSVSTDGHNVTGAMVSVNSSPATPQVATRNTLPTTFEHTIGIVTNGAGYNLARSNLTATTSVVLITSRTPAAGPGELTYDEWRAWEVKGWL